MLDERAAVMDRGHSEALFPMIRESLVASGRSFSNLHLIAVCTGPGNFTGVRIGIAAARGLVLSTNARAIGVDRFEALAHGHGGAVCVALKARGGAIHVARFEDGQPTLDAATVQPEDATAFADRALVAGDGAALLIAATGRGALGPEGADASLTTLALLAAAAPASAPRPAPRYLRAANAATPREAPPTILE